MKGRGVLFVVICVIVSMIGISFWYVSANDMYDKISAPVLNRSIESNAIFREIDALFKLLAISDGADALFICKDIGSFIVTHPFEFMLALESNPMSIGNIGQIVGFLGEEYIDNDAAEVVVLEERYTAIAREKEAPLYLKNIIMCELSGQIFTTRQSMLRMDNDKEIVTEYIKVIGYD